MERKPHAVLDLGSRRWKAQKIESLLRLDRRAAPLRLLEVGTGSGGIAHYFGAHERLDVRVTAVDVVDNRQVLDGYDFLLVTDTRLPFPDAAFDVVLSNHVIEHVGDRRAQVAHLRELHRVLDPEGIGYLAVPNRWQVVEPHYRLAFLSWLPRSWRSAYLRIMRRGEFYDCEPLRLPEIESLLREAGFDFENVCVEALRETLRIERPRTLAARLLERVPDRWLERLRAAIPTLIYRFRPLRGDDRARSRAT